ncbi:alpha-ketoacid dehydrogenase subunit beta, partial [Enterococcus faecalis]|nr:alpha-ketoacid dehydrogenase subunit beta [Enterococcus faecalis]
EIAAMVSESEAFDYLDAPIVRVASEDVPVPYASILENAILPNVEKIKAAVKKTVNKG